VPSPFLPGKQDEQSSTAAFEEYMGSVARAQRLFKIYKDSHPGQDHRSRPIPKTEVFRRRAVAQGFAAEEAEALLMLQ
jgi:hypothetical protein